MHWIDKVKKRKFQKQKDYYRQAILDGGIKLPALGCGVWVDVPEEAYGYFNKMELKELKVEIRLNEIKLCCLLNELD